MTAEPDLQLGPEPPTVTITAALAYLERHPRLHVRIGSRSIALAGSGPAHNWAAVRARRRTGESLEAMIVRAVALWQQRALDGDPNVAPLGARCGCGSPFSLRRSRRFKMWICVTCRTALEPRVRTS